jgi:hypothetical protein
MVNKYQQENPFSSCTHHLLKQVAFVATSKWKNGAE